MNSSVTRTELFAFWYWYRLEAVAVDRHVKAGVAQRRRLVLLARLAPDELGHRFSHIAAPLSNLLRNDTPFIWTDNEQKAFDELKAALMNGPVLIVPDQKMPYTVTTD